MPRLLALSVVLWSFVFVFLCLTSGTKPIAGDSALMCAAADALRTRGDFAIEPTRRDVNKGADGRYLREVSVADRTAVLTGGRAS